MIAENATAGVHINKAGNIFPRVLVVLFNLKNFFAHVHIHLSEKEHQITCVKRILTIFKVELKTKKHKIIIFSMSYVQ
ncbi:hypothetical protein ACTJM1_16675, partial [Enterobacter hormaechei]|uniref:hypothetical protein n=1 Tax=Enterobacter hormaechei TaxID=158836 RepID=UPI00403AE6F5